MIKTVWSLGRFVGGQPLLLDACKNSYPKMTAWWFFWIRIHFCCQRGRRYNLPLVLSPFQWRQLTCWWVSSLQIDTVQTMAILYILGEYATHVFSLLGFLNFKEEKIIFLIKLSFTVCISQNFLCLWQYRKRVEKYFWIHFFRLWIHLSSTLLSLCLPAWVLQVNLTQ